MEDISLFSTTLEELELFNPFPSLSGESAFLPDYEVYSCTEETKAPLTNLLAEDLLQELDFEGWYHFLSTEMFFVCSTITRVNL